MRYFCNPVNVNYRYQFNLDQRQGGNMKICREAADPSMICFQGRYYIFASMTLGVWVSDDLAHWQNHRLPRELPLYDYAPDVRVMGEWVYFCASRRDESCDRWRTRDILNGPYEKIPGNFPFWDPNLFIDDNGRVYFCTGHSLLYLDGDHTYDDWYKPGQTGLSECPICARWESGYYDMGMDNRRKYSSYLWISMLPEANSRMDVTVKTDRRDNYITKTIGVPLLSWETMDFSNFSFLLSRAPRMKRIKLKAKKYVYYKLIFSVDHPGARATVLGYDQQVRFASEVK
jgi:hypothetical protein